MKKGKRQINIRINFTNRWLYTLIVVGILAAIGIGVYALAPGVAPNPGHLLSDVAPPAPCNASQFLKWNGTNWNCANIGIASNSYWGWFTTGYQICESVCQTNGGPTSHCYLAQYTSSGAWSSCVTGDANQKRCFCISIWTQ